MPSGQFTVSGASKAEIAKIRRRIQFLSSTLAKALFKGSYVTEAALIAEHGNPKENWSYYNTSIGQTITYHKDTWYQYTVDGENGTGEAYKGEFAVAPSSPVTDDAYLDSVDGVVYIYNGIAWEIMSKSGTNITVTYHDSNYEATPDDPEDDPEAGSGGETEGWHLDATEDVNWLSQKVGAGDWGTPIPAKNLVGAVGPAGADGATGGTPVTDENLVGHWKMNDDLATTKVVDSSANGNDGEASANTDTLNTTGKINGAFDFRNYSDKITISDVSGLSTTIISVAGWCYYNSNKDYNYIVGHEWTADGWMLYSDANGQPIFGIAQSTVQKKTVSTYVIPVNTWVYLTGTYDGTTIRIYVNAVLVGSALLSNATIDAVGTVIIGDNN